MLWKLASLGAQVSFVFVFEIYFTLLFKVKLPMQSLPRLHPRLALQQLRLLTWLPRPLQVVRMHPRLLQVVSRLSWTFIFFSTSISHPDLHFGRSGQAQHRQRLLGCGERPSSGCHQVCSPFKCCWLPFLDLCICQLTLMFMYLYLFFFMLFRRKN